MSGDAPVLQLGDGSNSIEDAQAVVQEVAAQPLGGLMEGFTPQEIEVATALLDKKATEAAEKAAGGQQLSGGKMQAQGFAVSQSLLVDMGPQGVSNQESGDQLAQQAQQSEEERTKEADAHSSMLNSQIKSEAKGELAAQQAAAGKAQANEQALASKHRNASAGLSR